MVYSGYESTTAAAAGSGYTCANNSPCSQGVGYYAHADVTKYILCDYSQVCYEYDCAANQIWDQAQQTCDWM